MKHSAKMMSLAMALSMTTAMVPRASLPNAAGKSTGGDAACKSTGGKAG